MAAGDNKKKAADVALDLAKQFLTVAFGGIAFTVGLSFSAPDAITTIFFWIIVVSFGLSAAFGFLFLMNAIGSVNKLADDQFLDVSAGTLPTFSVLQILGTVVGTVALIVVLYKHVSKPIPPHTMSVKINAQQSVDFPIDSDKNVTIDVDGSKLKVSTSK
jgi:hypothetical protein